MADITVSYAGLDKHGVKRVRDTVTAIDADKKQVRLASGGTLPYDRLVVSPGIEFMYDTSAGLVDQRPKATVLHAWKAGPQTVALRKPADRHEGRRRGRDGNSAGAVPLPAGAVRARVPDRLVPEAGEAEEQADRARRQSGLRVEEAAVLARVRRGLQGHRRLPASAAPVTEIDVKTGTLVTEIGDKVRGDVINFIPPQRAANIARDAGLITANNRWCEVDWTTLESIKVKDVHVLGDATLSAPAMPKSGHMANQHGKAAAAAIVELLNGRPVTAADDGQHLLQLRRRQERRARLPACTAGCRRRRPSNRWPAPAASRRRIAHPGRSKARMRNGWAQTIWADMLA